MRYAAATIPVTPLNARAFGARDYRRTIVGGTVLGIGSMSAVAVMAGAVTVTAAWMVSGSLERNPQLRSAAPFAIQTAAFPEVPRRLADPADMFGSALAAANPAYEAPETPHKAELAAAEPATLPPAARREHAPERTAALTGNVPLPQARPLVVAEIPVKTIILHRPLVQVASAIAALPTLPAASAASIVSPHARQGVAGQDVARQDVARQDFARLDFARQDFARQDFARQDFSGQDFAGQPLARQGHVQQGYAQQGYAQQGYAHPAAAAGREAKARDMQADVRTTPVQVVAEIPVKTIIYRRPTVEAAPPVILPPAPAASAAPAHIRPARRDVTAGGQAPAREMLADADITGAIPPPDAPSRASSLPSGARAVGKAAGPQLAYNNPDTMPARDSHTAIYDIVAHTVYLPDGERLEAHSGLGRMLDDPHYASAKARGPTPPNTYDLTLRSGLFHGVQAIRLNPVADSKMYGRDGILAHTYMLGPSGQSFGCVSFKNYSEFLRAFQRGEVDRMVVVPHLAAPPPYAARAQRDDNQRYASSDW